MASSSSSSFLLSAADVSWGRRHCYTVQVTDAAADLSGESFLVYVPSANFAAEEGFQVWFDLDDGSVAPTPPAGETLIEVDVATGDTAAQVATKLADALEANANFRSKVDANVAAGDTVVVEANFKGPVETAASDVDSAVVITLQREGLGGDLGRTSGGVEVTLEATTADILSDQTGQLVLDRVFTGSTVEASMSFLEVTPERFKTIVGSVTGDVFTPAGGTELSGYGESRLYQSFFDLGGELVLHPTRFPASDRSRDITFWKSAPQPASINFSGEEPQTLEVTFAALADRDVVEAINQMAFGDSEQDVRA